MPTEEKKETEAEFIARVYSKYGLEIERIRQDDGSESLEVGYRGHSCYGYQTVHSAVRNIVRGVQDGHMIEARQMLNLMDEVWEHYGPEPKTYG